MAGQQLAVLDTSFWTVGHRADVLPYLFEFFTVHVPSAVHAEILAPDRHYPRRRYGYAALFALLERYGVLGVSLPARVEPHFGRGEAEAIALARERGWWLLINDSRPHQAAHERGIEVLSVPAFIRYLFEEAILSAASARRKLELITPVTSETILRPARQAMAVLAASRGEALT